jgi:hypothetical protein
MARLSGFQKMQRQKYNVLKDVAGLDGCTIYCVGFVGTPGSYGNVRILIDLAVAKV